MAKVINKQGMSREELNALLKKPSPHNVHPFRRTIEPGDYQKKTNKAFQPKIKQ